MEIKRLTLKKNVTWTLSGSIVYSLAQWLILVVIAKVGTAEMVGQYALGLAISAPIIMFSEMKLRIALVTDAKSSVDFSYYLGTRIVCMLFAIVAIILSIVIFGYSFQTMMIVLLIGIAKVFESLSDIFHGQLQKQERMDLIAISDMLKGIITVLTFASLLILTESLIVAVMGQVLIWALLLILYDCFITRKYVSISPKFHFKTVRGLIQLTLSLGTMALLSSINTNIPNYMVEHFLGKEELGYFAAIAYILYAGNRLVDSIRQPATPRLANLFERKDMKAFRKLLFGLLLVGLFIGIVGALVAYMLGSFLLTVIYTASYADYSGLFLIIMLAGLFSYPTKFLDAALNSTRSFKIQPYLALGWLVVSLSSCLLLIPSFGLYGAAFAVVIGSCAKCISYSIVLFLVMRKARKLHNQILETAAITV
ncbi:lipopolysaccharide biosynthesis protein [Filobacillus milosensis]|uniref:Lipopolysaccharide biosynthesis protein n=1 Tax=Filobacillus milosensis TaxID=94137 RepID=A0A4Y8IIF8_9BACI|nr:oligosaccharide flippase family protein [Filobacillus milosensis]TFB18912.1 lipopolysaccharide biosynthesis protein [Filobacillus milosensis]